MWARKDLLWLHLKCKGVAAVMETTVSRQLLLTSSSSALAHPFGGCFCSLYKNEPTLWWHRYKTITLLKLMSWNHFLSWICGLSDRSYQAASYLCPLQNFVVVYEIGGGFLSDMISSIPATSGYPPLSSRWGSRSPMTLTKGCRISSLPLSCFSAARYQITLLVSTQW